MKMKTDQVSKIVTNIMERYRFTFHPLFNGESGLLKIEEFHYKKTFLGKMTYWKRIYFGHDTPIREAIQFFDSCINQSNKKGE